MNTKTNKIYVEGHELAPAEFYFEQMQRLVNLYNSDGVRAADLGLPIMSFFAGKLVSEPKSSLFAGHIDIFLLDESMQCFVDRDPKLFFSWASTTFYYFLEMAVFPQIARSIWSRCWMIVEMLGARVPDDATLVARCQMAAWAAVYDKSSATHALPRIKGMILASDQLRAYRSLFLSSAINKDQIDFAWHTKNAFNSSQFLSPIHKLHAYINYYCSVEATREILNFIISAINWPEMAEYRSGKMGLLETVVWTMQSNNNYDDLLFLQRSLKYDIRREDFQTSHAFLLPSLGEVFTALKKSEKISYPCKDNGASYVKLMQLCNKLNGVVISIRGQEETEVYNEVEKFEDYGTPNRNDEFNELRDAVINHYHLEDDFYKELNHISLIPSHNHPVQAALCSLKVVPPTISTSLRDLTDEGQQRHFIFFLSSATYTHDVELNWIRSKFGDSVEVYTDPDPDLLVKKIFDNQYSHIYISAHGQHDHWDRMPDRIHFSESSELSIEKLKVARTESSQRRTLILNICDGAATRISFNINNSGLAAALASSDQVVVSHLWPVNPKYAAIFGLLMLDRLIHESVNEAALHVYGQLSQNNSRIAESIENMGTQYVELAKMIRNTEFEIADFRNIGSLAIYG